MLGEGVVGGGVLEVADVVVFGIVEIQAAEQPKAPGLIGGEADLVRRPRVVGVLGVLLGGVVAVVGVQTRAVEDVAAAQIVGDVAAAVVVVRVVDDGIHFAGEMAARVDHVQIEHAALGGPRCQAEVVAVVLRRESCRGVVLAQAGIDDERTLGLQRLGAVLQQHFPVVAQVVQQAEATAAIGGVVPVLLHQPVVADGFHGIRVSQQRPEAATGAIAVHHFGTRREGGGDIVHPTALAVAVDDGSHGQRIGERNVHEAICGSAVGTVLGGAEVGVEAGVESNRIRLASNQPQVAGLGTRAEQRALRPGEHLDAFEVGTVDIQIATAERNRLFVQVERHARRRALRGRDGDAGLLRGAAADVDFLLARAVAGAHHVGQVVHVLVEGFDADFAQRVAAEGIHRHRHVLDARLALGGGNDDRFQRPTVRLHLRRRRFIRLRDDAGGAAGHRRGNGDTEPGSLPIAGAPVGPFLGLLLAGHGFLELGWDATWIRWAIAPAATC